MKLKNQVCSLESAKRLKELKAVEINEYPKYFVTAKGEVFSSKYGDLRELKQVGHKGYRRVFLSKENMRKPFQVHRLVAIHFVIGRDEEKIFVNHKDGNKANNNAVNLEWCSASENQKHAYDVLGVRNGHTGYRYSKLYPTEETRNKLVALGIPRSRHNLAELGEMLPNKYYHCQDRTMGGGYCFSFGDEQGIYAKTEAEARALMMIYLLENKLITL